VEAPTWTWCLFSVMPSVASITATSARSVTAPLADRRSVGETVA
jgi:hypothetical protein